MATIRTGDTAGPFTGKEYETLIDFFGPVISVYVVVVVAFVSQEPGWNEPLSNRSK